MKSGLTLAQAVAVVRDFRMPYKILKEEFHIPHHIGVPKSPRYSWDGSRLAITKSTTAPDIIHELGHWVIAPPSRRQLRDFGLGMGFRSRSDSPRVVSDEFSQTEEVQVCVFEIASFAFWEKNWKAVAAKNVFDSPYEYGTWEGYAESEDAAIKRDLAELQKRKIFKGYYPVGLPKLETLSWHIEKVQKELDDAES